MWASNLTTIDSLGTLHLECSAQSVNGKLLSSNAGLLLVLLNKVCTKKYEPLLLVTVCSVTNPGLCTPCTMCSVA